MEGIKGEQVQQCEEPKGALCRTGALGWGGCGGRGEYEAIVGLGWGKKRVESRCFAVAKL